MVVLEGLSKQSDVTTLTLGKGGIQVSSQWVWQDGRFFLKNPVWKNWMYTIQNTGNFVVFSRNFWSSENEQAASPAKHCLCSHCLVYLKESNNHGGTITEWARISMSNLCATRWCDGIHAYHRACHPCWPLHVTKNSAEHIIYLWLVIELKRMIWNSPVQSWNFQKTAFFDVVPFLEWQDLRVCNAEAQII